MEKDFYTIAVFYPVDNEYGYDANFDAGTDQRTYEDLCEVDGRRIFNLDMCDDLYEFQYLYNHEEFDGGWWVQILYVDDL